MLPAGAEHQIAGIAQFETRETAEAVIVVRSVDEIVVALELETGEGRPGDEIGHAGNRVRAIGRTRAILEQLDPLEREQRHQLRVDEARAGAEDGTLAVEQHERALRAEPAQVKRTDALETLRIGGELVAVAERRANRGQFLDELERAVDALFGKIVRREHIDGEGGIFGRAADVRSGHHDTVVILRGRTGGFHLGLRECGRCVKRSGGKRAQRTTMA